jgi:hypothetical protein
MTIYKLQSQTILKQLKVLSFESLTSQMCLIRRDSEIGRVLRKKADIAKKDY